MKRAKDFLSVAWEFVKGKKTYLAGIAAVIYGFVQGQDEMIVIGLGLLGLRHGVTTEVSRVLNNK